MAMGEMSEEDVDTIVAQAEEKALEAEAAAQEARRKKREEERLAVIEAEYAAAEAAAGDATATATGAVDGPLAESVQNNGADALAETPAEDAATEEGGATS